MNWVSKLKAVRTDAVVLFDEPQDERILKACRYLKKNKICTPVFVSKKEINGFVTIKPEIKKYAKIFEKKKLQKKLLSETNWYATMLLSKNLADAYISGASNPTSRTLKPALKLLNSGFASSYFLMLGKNNYLFADCAFNIAPDYKQLAKIAIQTHDSAKRLKIKPKVAMLSFSTNGSAKHSEVDKVKKATTLAKKKIKVEGEMQFDAAINPEIAKKKFPKSKIAGQANVLIFPELNSANIGYKIATQIGGMKAIGPITQGFKKPVNDLSRGCTVEEIILTAALTVMK
jgi:phosphate acetyltransferase